MGDREALRFLALLEETAGARGLRWETWADVPASEAGRCEVVGWCEFDHDNDPEGVGDLGCSVLHGRTVATATGPDDVVVVRVRALRDTWGLYRQHAAPLVGVQLPACCDGEGFRAAFTPDQAGTLADMVAVFGLSELAAALWRAVAVENGVPESVPSSVPSWAAPAGGRTPRLAAAFTAVHLWGTEG